MARGKHNVQGRLLKHTGFLSGLFEPPEAIAMSRVDCLILCLFEPPEAITMSRVDL